MTFFVVFDTLGPGKFDGTKNSSILRIKLDILQSYCSSNKWL